MKKKDIIFVGIVLAIVLAILVVSETMIEECNPIEPVFMYLYLVLGHIMHNRMKEFEYERDESAEAALEIGHVSLLILSTARLGLLIYDLLCTYMPYMYPLDLVLSIIVLIVLGEIYNIYLCTHFFKFMKRINTK